jgi:hypothetical protein
MVPAASCLAYCWAAWACEAKAGHSGAFPGRKAIHRVDPKPTANPPSKLLLWAKQERRQGERQCHVPRSLRFLSSPLRYWAKRRPATRNQRIHIHGARSYPAPVVAQVVPCPAITRAGSSAGQQCPVSAVFASRVRITMGKRRRCRIARW